MDEATMTAEVRVFCREYQTPSTVRLLVAAETGAITWAEAHQIATDALAAGLTAVTENGDQQ